MISHRLPLCLLTGEVKPLLTLTVGLQRGLHYEDLGLSRAVEMQTKRTGTSDLKVGESGKQNV